MLVWHGLAAQPRCHEDHHQDESLRIPAVKWKAAKGTAVTMNCFAISLSCIFQFGVILFESLEILGWSTLETIHTRTYSLNISQLHTLKDLTRFKSRTGFDRGLRLSWANFGCGWVRSLCCSTDRSLPWLSRCRRWWLSHIVTKCKPLRY